MEAAELAANTRCEDVLLLDTRGYSPIADYFVIATGSSPRQMRSVCDEIAELGEKRDQKALWVSGYDSETWILADFVNVIVHVFSSDGGNITIWRICGGMRRGLSGRKRGSG